jgi:curved DNA-binding protein CbpA
MNPYEILGVRRNASLKTIKAAYRAKAKLAHPDVHGGSAEDFHALHRAWRILSDPARRLVFDQTGRTDDADPDNTRTQVLSAAFMALEAALDRLRDSRPDPLRCDVVREMVIMTNDQLRQRRVEHDQVAELAEFYQSLLGRFARHDSAPSEFDGMIASKLVDIERQLQESVHRIEVLKKTLDLIRDHSFRCDQAEIHLSIAMAWDGVFSGTATS